MTRTSARRASPQPAEKTANTQASMDSEPRPSAENSEEVRRQLKKASIEEEQAMAIPQTENPSEREQDNATSTANGDEGATENESRGRLRRKRSHDDVDGEATGGIGTASTGKHARKRSKSGGPEEIMVDKPSSSQDTVEDPAVPALAASQVDSGSAETANGSLHVRAQTPEQGTLDEDEQSLLISPKNKRTRDEFQRASVAREETDAAQDENTSASVDGSSKPAKRARDSDSPQPGTATGQPSTEREEETKIPPSSGFANASATSPFATVASPKSPQTSASAFASSGFSTFASASASPFAAAAPAAGSVSPFGGFGSKPSLAPPATSESADKSSPSPFGGVLGASTSSKSPFALAGAPSLVGGTTSGFGTLGTAGSSGFGGLSGSGSSAFGSGFAAVKPSGGLSSFLTPGAVGITGLSGKPAKPFGAAEDEDEDEDSNGGDDDNESNAADVESGIKSPPTTLSTEKKDKRFFEQRVTTGEENETTIFTARAKLMVYDGGQWKERGLGALKLNTSYAETDGNDEDGSLKTKARLLMRAEGSQRVVLNSILQKDLPYGTAHGARPGSTEHFQFVGLCEGKMTTLLVKMKQQNKEELWDRIEALKKQI